MTSFKEPLRLMGGLLLDYLRWMVVIPMVVAWAFFLLTVLIMVLVNFESSIMELVERTYAWYVDKFGPVAWMEEPDELPVDAAEVAPGTQEALHFTGDDLMPWIMKAWSILALAAWLLGWLRSLVFGPRPPRSLSNKVRWALLGALVCWGLLLIAYFFGETEFHGSFLGWIALFTGATMLVVLVSVCVLGLATALDLLHQRLLPGDRVISASQVREPQ